MALYKLILAYDGSAFGGSQRQAQRRTVQAELETAARKLGWTGASLALAGRTDAGVHARGQVAAMELAWPHGIGALPKALNANLKADLVVVEAQEVAPGFHPRFDAKWRHYRYELRCSPQRHPLDDRFAWRVWPKVTVRSLQRVARNMTGAHDFGAFGAAARSGGCTKRTVLRSTWSSEAGRLRYDVIADGFLYRMVRRLVFVQVAVGQEKCEESSVSLALEDGRGARGLPGGLAPPSGLCLMEVRY